MGEVNRKYADTGEEIKYEIEIEEVGLECGKLEIVNLLRR